MKFEDKPDTEIFARPELKLLYDRASVREIPSIIYDDLEIVTALLANVINYETHITCSTFNQTRIEESPYEIFECLIHLMQTEALFEFKESEITYKENGSTIAFPAFNEKALLRYKSDILWLRGALKTKYNTGHWLFADATEVWLSDLAILLPTTFINIIEMKSYLEYLDLGDIDES